MRLFRVMADACRLAAVRSLHCPASRQPPPGASGAGLSNGWPVQMPAEPAAYHQRPRSTITTADETGTLAESSGLFPSVARPSLKSDLLR